MTSYVFPSVPVLTPIGAISVLALAPICRVAILIELSGKARSNFAFVIFDPSFSGGIMTLDGSSGTYVYPANCSAFVCRNVKSEIPVVWHPARTKKKNGMNFLNMTRPKVVKYLLPICEKLHSVNMLIIGFTFLSIYSSISPPIDLNWVRGDGEKATRVGPVASFKALIFIGYLQSVQ